VNVSRNTGSVFTQHTKPFPASNLQTRGPVLYKRCSGHYFRFSFAFRCFSANYGTVVLSVRKVGVLWPNGWMDQDVTWYEGPGGIMLGGDSSLPHGKGHSSPPHFSTHVVSAHVYRGQTVAYLSNCWAFVRVFDALLWV